MALYNHHTLWGTSYHRKTHNIQQVKKSFKKPRWALISFHILLTGIMVFKLKNEDKSRSQRGEEFFKFSPYSALSGNFSNAREVTGMFQLPPGSYVIIPLPFIQTQRETSYSER